MVRFVRPLATFLGWGCVNKLFGDFRRHTRFLWVRSGKLHKAILLAADARHLAADSVEQPLGLGNHHLGQSENANDLPLDLRHAEQ